MKFLRCSGYGGDEEANIYPPMTVVVAADDLKVAPDEYRERMHMSGVFSVMDEFEHPGPLEDAVIVGMERQREREVTERNQALSYHWNAAVLRIAREAVANPAPAPLTVKEITEVLLQLAKHDNYSGQSIECYTINDQGVMTQVMMKDAKVTTKVVRTP
jgi:hypothetical protein